MPGAESTDFAKSMSQTMISPEFFYWHIPIISYKSHEDEPMSSRSKNDFVSVAGQVHPIAFM